ncbi:hypothetical protein NMY22_g12143 [Coprinellus aureogranulatus]|nr:hypothetical protein NMY22_g12143 [Coprinellus aureogranulatus]
MSVGGIKWQAWPLDRYTPYIRNPIPSNQRTPCFRTAMSTFSEPAVQAVTGYPTAEDPLTIVPLEFNADYLKSCKIMAFSPRRMKPSNLELLLRLGRLFGPGLTRSEFRQMMRMCAECHNMAFADRRDSHQCDGSPLQIHEEGFDFARALFSTSKNSGLIMPSFALYALVDLGALYEMEYLVQACIPTLALGHSRSGIALQPFAIAQLSPSLRFPPQPTMTSTPCKNWLSIEAVWNSPAPGFEVVVKNNLSVRERDAGRRNQECWSGENHVCEWDYCDLDIFSNHAWMTLPRIAHGRCVRFPRLGYRRLNGVGGGEALVHHIVREAQILAVKAASRIEVIWPFLTTKPLEMITPISWKRLHFEQHLAPIVPSSAPQHIVCTQSLSRLQVLVNWQWSACELRVPWPNSLSVNLPFSVTSCQRSVFVERDTCATPNVWLNIPSPRYLTRRPRRFEYLLSKWGAVSDANRSSPNSRAPPNSLDNEIAASLQNLTLESQSDSDHILLISANLDGYQESSVVTDATQSTDRARAHISEVGNGHQRRSQVYNGRYTKKFGSPERRHKRRMRVWAAIHNQRYTSLLCGGCAAAIAQAAEAVAGVEELDG